MSKDISASGDAFTGETISITVAVNVTIPITVNMYPEGSTHDEIIAIEKANIEADPCAYVEMAQEEGNVAAIVAVSGVVANV